MQEKAIKHGAIMVAAVPITWLPYSIVAVRAIFSEPAGNVKKENIKNRKLIKFGAELL